MKDGLASFDLLALTAELQGLVGGYVDKVYQRADELVLKVNVSGQGRREVYAKVGKWLCLREVPDKPETPPPFAATLRQHLDNARIAGIEQRGFDRILILTFDRGSQLVFELFGKGNVVLVRDGTTVAAYTRTKFRDRTVSPGAPYDFPPPAADPFAMTRESFAAAIVAAKGGLVKALASGMNLGGPYAEEVCLRAGVEKSAKASDPGDERLARVHDALLELRRQVRDARDPRVVLEAGSPIDATPVPLQQHAGRVQEAFPTFSEALVSYLERAVPKPPPEDGPTAKLRRRLEQQEESLRAGGEEAVRAEALAQLLYAHFAPFDELLTKARAGTLEPGGTILAVDKDARVVRVAVGDAAQIELDWTKDVLGNSQVLYDRKKELVAKAEKIEEAIVETRRQLERAEKEAAKAVARPRTKATKAFWFEAYRWFLSSEGFLVIGGRDAKTNDAIVKKHLKDGDRYVHADVHGAPSCVVKRGSEAGEATLQEACAFALAWSKAWSAGLASGSAFWVLPEQVSKQAESGEYVSRGAWVIRGKRNYVHDSPVRAAVGEIEHEGHRKVMAGPPSAVAARSTRNVLIEPGEMDKNALARSLAAAFQVPIVEIQRVLPPGPVRVVERRGVEV